MKDQTEKKKKIKVNQLEVCLAHTSDVSFVLVRKRVKIYEKIKHKTKTGWI